MLPASTDTSIPDPYSNGYMYGGSAFALVDIPYPADMEAAAKAGTLQPIDYTHQNSSYAMGPEDPSPPRTITWIQALVDGRVFNADFHRQWLGSPQPADPAEPQYGYGIERQSFAPNVTMYYHFGELPGFNSFSGYDPGKAGTNYSEPRCSQRTASGAPYTV
jgi:D-alanyl-D-alanine carboxypeptidase